MTGVVYVDICGRDSIMIRKWRYYGRKNNGRYDREDRRGVRKH